MTNYPQSALPALSILPPSKLKPSRPIAREQQRPVEIGPFGALRGEEGGRDRRARCDSMQPTIILSPAARASRASASASVRPPALSSLMLIAA